MSQRGGVATAWAVGDLVSLDCRSLSRFEWRCLANIGRRTAKPVLCLFSDVTVAPEIRVS